MDINYVRGIARHSHKLLPTALRLLSVQDHKKASL